MPPWDKWAWRESMDSLRRVLVDPPHRILGRFVRTGLRSRLATAATKHPLDSLVVALRRGVGIRSLHALHAAADPERLALVDRHRQVTYRQANAEIDALAAGFTGRLGLRRGTPVMLMMENRAEYLLTWFGLIRAGLPAAHVSRHSTTEELEPLAERSAAKAIVVSPETLQPVLQMVRRRPDLGLKIIVVGGDPAPELIDYGSLAAGSGADEQPARDPGPSDNVVYTSGTTGRPKGAVRDFRSFGAIELFRILDRLPLQAEDRHLVAAPLYHSSGQVFAMINTALGATLYITEKFEAAATLEALSRHRINNVFLVPTMIHRLVQLDATQFAAHPTPELRAVISGAAPFSHALRQKAIARFGADAVFDFYGATELGWVTLVDGHEMMARPGTLGRAIPGQEVAIFDDAGAACPTGEIGRVYTRSAQLMSGYLGDRAATEATKSQGWVTVDDLGYLDDEGYLFLTGRERDMVISGGINIYPIEVENVLARHPQIREVAVIGVPDSEWGQRLTAVIVADDEVDPEAIAVWAREQMAPYKIPRRWERLPALPRNPTGKVIKRDLEQRFANPSPGS